MNEAMDIQLIAYLEGRLSARGRAVLEQQLADDQVLFQKFDQYRSLMESIEESPEPEPPASLSAGFYHALENEKQQKASEQQFGKAGGALHRIRKLWQQSTLLKVAASVALFMAGFLVDKQLQTEQVQTQQMQQLQTEITATKSLVMLALLKQQSASERIKAVNYAYEMEEANQEVIDALVYTINNDENSNVRLAACEALAMFSDEEQVKSALMASLPAQTDPVIQIFLVELMISMDDKNALVYMQQLMEQQELIETVQNKVYSGIGQLM